MDGEQANLFILFACHFHILTNKLSIPDNALHKPDRVVDSDRNPIDQVNQSIATWPYCCVEVLENNLWLLFQELCVLLEVQAEVLEPEFILEGSRQAVVRLLSRHHSQMSVGCD